MGCVAVAGQRALKFFGIVADAKGGRESTRALRTHIQCDGVVDVPIEFHRHIRR